MLGTDEVLYGCLNPECAQTLKSGLISNQFIMMFVILGLAFLNMFSIGLASHTIKFDIHYKNLLLNACVFLSLLVIIVLGVLATAISTFPQLQVNPQSIEYTKSKFELPALRSTTEFNESEWFPFVEKLQVAETCEGIADPDDTCNALDYKIEIQATSGSLRLALH